MRWQNLALAVAILSRCASSWPALCAIQRSPSSLPNRVVLGDGSGISIARWSKELSLAHTIGSDIEKAYSRSDSGVVTPMGSRA
jgi:hypothetical protein